MVRQFAVISRQCVPAAGNFLQVHQRQCFQLGLDRGVLLIPDEVLAMDPNLVPRDFLVPLSTVIFTILFFAVTFFLLVMLVFIVWLRVLQAAQGVFPRFMAHEAVGYDQVHIVGVTAKPFAELSEEEPAGCSVV